MQTDFKPQQSRVSEKERREQMLRVVRAVAGALVVGGAGLIFGFAMGLQDARWADAWTQVAHASSLLSTQGVRGASPAANSGMIGLNARVF